MKQENNGIQEEIDQMDQAIFHPKEEPNDLENEWLKTNEWIEAVSDFEMFSEQLQRVIANPHRWKWAIIALHGGIQGMMVLVLEGSHGLNVLHEKDAERWLIWYEGDRSTESPSRDLKLANFLDLYKKIKYDKPPMKRLELPRFGGVFRVELPRFGGEFMACVSILFLMQFFISYRRMVGDGRMPAMRIIPPFNVGEDSQACFLMCMERPAIDQLTFKGGEEALAQGVVIAVASRAHRGTYACFTATLTKCYRGILRALVRVVDHVFGTALVKCHVQSLQDQRTLQVCCHCPAHDAA